jgi:hypothetical protein
LYGPKISQKRLMGMEGEVREEVAFYAALECLMGGASMRNDWRAGKQASKPRAQKGNELTVHGAVSEWRQSHRTLPSLLPGCPAPQRRRDVSNRQDRIGHPCRSAFASHGRCGRGAAARSEDQKVEGGVWAASASAVPLPSRLLT